MRLGWTKFSQKHYFQSKAERVHQHWIFEIQSSWSTKLQLKLKVLIFWTKFTQNVENRKSEQYHGILHIRISQGTKFHLKLTILIFWTKFAQNRCFRSKTEEVNSTIEFSKLVQVLNFIVIVIVFLIIVKCIWCSHYHIYYKKCFP